MTSRIAKFIAAIGLVAVPLFLVRAASGQGNADWTRPFPAFKLIGNIYWVGSYDLSTYLITTPQGHFLVNTGIGDTAEKIKASVEQLGFKMSDVKILTATHGHWDHAAGMADLKKMTGAALVVSEPEKVLFESGGKADFRFGDTPSAQFEPVKVDRTFKDGETLALGETRLTAHLHPGHTKGATSFTTEIRENGRDLSRRDCQHGFDQPWRDGHRDGVVSRHPAGLRTHLCGAAGDEDRRLPGVTRIAVRDAFQVQTRRRV